MRPIPLWTCLAIVVSCALCAACSDDADQQSGVEAHDSPLAEKVSWYLEVAEETRSLNWDFDYGLLHWDGSQRKGRWWQRTILHGRYALTAEVDFVWDMKLSIPRPSGAPEFSLRECTRIERRPSGELEFQYAPGSAMLFGKEMWYRIVRASGDLSVLGIEIIEDKPVDGSPTTAQIDEEIRKSLATVFERPGGAAGPTSIQERRERIWAMERMLESCGFLSVESPGATLRQRKKKYARYKSYREIVAAIMRETEIVLREDPWDIAMHATRVEMMYAIGDLERLGSMLRTLAAAPGRPGDFFYEGLYASYEMLSDEVKAEEQQDHKK